MLFFCFVFFSHCFLLSVFICFFSLVLSLYIYIYAIRRLLGPHFRVQVENLYTPETDRAGADEDLRDVPFLFFCFA